jgi:hypothetical protein
MGSEAVYTPAHFEVRCPRCQVSFPPETRRCLHCGGPTSKPGPNKGLDWVHTTDGAGDQTSESEWFPSAGRELDPDPEPLYAPEPFSGREREVSEAGEQTGSWPRTLLRTVGSLLWIVVLIAFTLMRNCTKEG